MSAVRLRIVYSLFYKRLYKYIAIIVNNFTSIRKENTLFHNIKEVVFPFHSVEENNITEKVRFYQKLMLFSIT